MFDTVELQCCRSLVQLAHSCRNSKFSRSLVWNSRILRFSLTGYENLLTSGALSFVGVLVSSVSCCYLGNRHPAPSQSYYHMLTLHLLLRKVIVSTRQYYISVLLLRKVIMVFRAPTECYWFAAHGACGSVRAVLPGNGWCLHELLLHIQVIYPGGSFIFRLVIHN